MSEKADIITNLIYGIDTKLRRIYFGHPIDSGEEVTGQFNCVTVELAIRAIHKMASDAPKKPIEIHMHSFGGDVYAMLRLHDEIKCCPCQIKFFGGGVIMSAATWIMAACDERHLHVNSTVMIHEISDEIPPDTLTNIKISHQENERLMDILCNIYSENSHMPAHFWRDICQRDVYLTAQEALDLGLADKIIQPCKRGNFRRSRQAAMKKSLINENAQMTVKSIYKRISRSNYRNIKLNVPCVEELSNEDFIFETEDNA